MGQYGSRLEERYFIQKVKLGQGSFGTVWRAVDKETDRIVAIKQIDKLRMRQRGVTREHTAREISMLKLCCHENVTKLFHTYEDATSIYLAMEYCEGGDFGDKLRERAPDLKEEEAADWTRQIVSAIVALHARQICHRDVKPDNFMVAGRCLKLSDFGLAVHSPHGKLLSEKCGTPAFMSPEQHQLPRSRGYGSSADVWATGVLAFMIICGGRHPFISNEQRTLDMDRLLSGELQYSQSKGFFSLGFMTGNSEGGFSDRARSFCKDLVNPRPGLRPNAEKALKHCWLQAGTMPPEPAIRRQAAGDSREVVGSPAPAPDLRRESSPPQEAFVRVMDTWVSASKAAREAAAEAMATAPHQLSKALNEVKDAMQSKSSFGGTETQIPREEQQRLEAELCDMGARPDDLMEVRELLYMGADVHDVRQTMRRRLADRHRAVAEGSSGSASVDEREALKGQLLAMGFAPELVDEAAKTCSTTAAAMDWILGCEQMDGR